MIAGVPWSDAAIALVLALAAIKGLRRGFVREIGGALAVAAGLIAPWYYNGSLDGTIARTVGANPSVAHALGMFATGVVAYAIVMGAVWVLGAIVRVPILGTGNALAGGAVGILKAAVFVWIVLYVALFFPLTPAIRANLHVSHLAPIFTTYDANVDRALLGAIPPVAQPLLRPYFDAHHL